MAHGRDGPLVVSVKNVLKTSDGGEWFGRGFGVCLPGKQRSPGMRGRVGSAGFQRSNSNHIVASSIGGARLCLG